MVKILENIVFRLRAPILIFLLGCTIYAGWAALDLRLDAGFDKQLPIDHEYVQTFQQYRDSLFGSNRIIVVLKARQGTIWNKDYFTKYKELTDEVFYLPGVARHTVTSLWTPNTRYLEITEEGISADDVIPGTITVETLSDEALKKVENNVIRGNFVGRLVATDFSSAMVRAELLEYDPKTQERLDYFDLAASLEEKIRQRFEDENYEVQIIGFAKLIGDIADKAGADVYDPADTAPLWTKALDFYGVVQFFFTTAFLLTALALYFYARSMVLSLVTLSCSLVSVVWQFGILALLGYGLDPLAILVPFLVFAIGVSHGVQQINLITKEVAEGATPENAARASFSGLLVPGSMALITDLVGFGTLYLIPIPMIKELSVTASIGVALKIVTNLIMLPLLVSYFRFSPDFSEKVARARRQRLKVMRLLGVVAHKRFAPIGLIAAAILLAFAVRASQDRHVGALHPGSPELRPLARYNLDSTEIAKKFALGLNLLTVVIETPEESCVKYPYMRYLDRFSWHMDNVDDVSLVLSLPYVVKQTSAGWNEGNLKWQAIPRNNYALVQAVNVVPPRTSGLYSQDCSVMPQLIFLKDAKAQTIQRTVAAVKAFRDANPPPFRDLVITTPEPLHLPTTLPEKLLPPGLELAFYRETDDKIILTYSPSRHTPAGLVKAMEEKGVAVKSFQDRGVKIRLASGNMGVQAAVNEEIERTELPMLLYVYAAIIFLVALTYRDWRAVIACCAPLTMATFLGYWFMKEIEIGLTVSTLPVMVLAVGLGVDYAFYIYNRIQFHLSEGDDISLSYQKTLEETGMAVVFTALTMAIGVSTWAFSGLKFQADMGLLLAFMFTTNMVMAITALPCLAVVMDMLFPRKSAVKPPAGAFSH